MEGSRSSVKGHARRAGQIGAYNLYILARPADAGARLDKRAQTH